MKIKLDDMIVDYKLNEDGTEEITHKTDDFEVSFIFKNDANLHKKSMEALEDFFIRTDL